MNSELAISTRLSISIRLGLFFSFLIMASVAPIVFSHNQLITGTIVNATLFSAAMFLGLREAILIGLCPSIIAVTFGLLPLPFLPFVPFIIVGNTILVTLFSKISIKNYWPRALIASMAKFLFLFAMSVLLTKYINIIPLGKKLVLMMSWPQLITALLGAVVVFLFSNLALKINQKN